MNDKRTMENVAMLPIFDFPSNDNQIISTDQTHYAEAA